MGHSDLTLTISSYLPCRLLTRSQHQSLHERYALLTPFIHFDHTPVHLLSCILIYISCYDVHIICLVFYITLNRMSVYSILLIVYV